MKIPMKPVMNKRNLGSNPNGKHPYLTTAQNQSQNSQDFTTRRISNNSDKVIQIKPQP